jgi:hypothetical protein
LNSEFIRRLYVTPRSAPATGRVPVGAVLLEEMAAMRPGQVMKMRDIDGRDFAVIAMEDLEYITERAGMSLKSSK